MDKPISVGDLVQVVRSCCTKRVNRPTFIVGEIKGGGGIQFGYSYCSSCMTPMPNVYFAMPAGGMPVGQPLPWLKRIPPLDELEGVKHDEEITA